MGLSFSTAFGISTGCNHSFSDDAGIGRLNEFDRLIRMDDMRLSIIIDF
jgi:hypothetical protein